MRPQLHLINQRRVIFWRCILHPPSTWLRHHSCQQPAAASATRRHVRFAAAAKHDADNASSWKVAACSQCGTKYIPTTNPLHVM